MCNELIGCTVAVVATDGVERIELTLPVEKLREAGAEVHVIAPNPGKIQAYDHLERSALIPVDHCLAEVDPDDYDALMLPGGMGNPDSLRLTPEAIAFIHRFVDARKPIAAICHGVWTLTAAGGVRGRRLTSWPSLRTDLVNAGAEWVDEPVVVDDGLVTARTRQDIVAFCAKMVDEFQEGQHPVEGPMRTYEAPRGLP